MKVLEVTTSYPRFRGDYPGIFNFRLDRELVKTGVEVTVLAPGAHGRPAEEEIDGITVKRIPYFFPSRLQRLAYGAGMKQNVFAHPWVVVQIPLLFFSFFIQMLLLGRRSDIIHCHWAPVGFLGLLEKPVIGKPVVLTLGGTDYRDLPKFFTRFVTTNVDAVISVAAETSKFLEGIGVKDFHIIRTLIDEEEFHPGIDGSDVRDEFSLAGKKVVLFVGRFNVRKGTIPFLEAVPHVVQKRNDVCFVMVGDGELMDEARVFIREHNIENHVILAGARSDVNKFLAVSDVYVKPAVYENTWSNTIAEAMFMEVPVILTDVGYTSELWTHMKDAYLVPPNDPRVLASAIIEVLGDKSLRKKLVEGSNQLLVTSGKRSDAIIGALSTLYSRLVSF